VRRLRIFLWVLVFLAGGSSYVWSQYRTRSAAAPLTYGALPPFELLDQRGEPFRRDSMLGTVWIADFVFTSCVETCPMLTSRMKQLERGLRESGATTLTEKGGVRLVSFSVDPAIDTPQRLAEYAQKWNVDPRGWVFVTGSTDVVEKVVTEGFKLGVTRVPKATFVDIVHSNRFVLIDRQGKLRGYYDAEAPEEMRKLQEDALRLQKE
jgi:protein SCO1/2